MKDYSLYIAAAYAICFIVLGGMTFLTVAAWRKIK